MSYQVVTAPTFEPVTLTEAKAHLKMDYSTEDTYITTMISSARNMVEEYLGRILPQATVKESFDCFPSYSASNLRQFITLSVFPVQSISSILYNDTGGAQQTLSTDVYRLNNILEPCRVEPKVNQYWPTNSGETGNIIIQYVAGYTQATDIPAAIRQAILLIIGDWHANRDDRVRNMTTQSKLILNRFKVY